jgi:hypothetical protein
MGKDSATGKCVRDFLLRDSGREMAGALPEKAQEDCRRTPDGGVSCHKFIPEVR